MMGERDLNFSELVDTSYNNSIESLLTLTRSTASEGVNLGSILVVIIVFALIVFAIAVAAQIFNRVRKTDLSKLIPKF